MKDMKKVSQYLILSIVVASVVRVWALTLSHPSSLDWSVWAYSEWLINYDTGFVRRGLSGWLIALASGHGDGLAAINLWVFANYALMCALLVWVWSRSPSRSVTVLALAILVPGGLFQMAAGNQFYFRKEILFHVALGVDCALYGLVAATDAAHRLRRAQLFFAVFLVQSVVLPLVHESYLFVSFPASWLLARNVANLLPEPGDARRHARLVALSLVLGLAMFVICAIFKGTDHTAVQMWNMLAPADRDRLASDPTGVASDGSGTVIGGISALGWSTVANFANVLQIFVRGQFWIWAFAAAGIAVVLLLLTLFDCMGQHRPMPRSPRAAIQTGVFDADMLRRNMMQLWFLFIASSPMYLLGVDWGRWMSSLTMSYLFVMFADHRAPLLVPAWLRGWTRRNPPERADGADGADGADAEPGLLHAFVRSAQRHRIAWLLVALLFCLTFRSPECCMGGISFNPFYQLKPYVMKLVG